MDIIIIVFLALAVLILIAFAILKKEKKKPIQKLSESYRRLLIENVDFYNELDDAKKNEFENRMQLFLSRVRITGIKTTVEDIDKVLIAASAIIPIFGFPDWEYINLHEVLVYPGAFDETFNQEGADRDILGLVGTGPYQNVMVLSKPGLREGF